VLEKLITAIDKGLRPIEPILFTRIHAINKETFIFHYSQKFTWILSSMFSIIFWTISTDQSRDFLYFLLLTESFIAVMVTAVVITHFLKRVSSIAFFKTLNVDPPLRLVKHLLTFFGVLATTILAVVFVIPDIELPGTAMRLMYVFLSPYFYGGMVAFCLSGIAVNALSLFFMLFRT
jgi:hypothetical protein